MTVLNLCFKVVSFEDGKLYSAYLSGGKFRLRYIPGEWTFAPDPLLENYGYGIFAYQNKPPRDVIQCKGLQLWQAEYEDGDLVQTRLDYLLDPYLLSRDKIAPAEWLEFEPGFIMLRKIRLIRRMHVYD